jgi:hypothetical protein
MRIFLEDFVVIFVMVAADDANLERGRVAVNDRSGVVYFEKNVLPANLGFFGYRFLLLCNSYFT